MKSETLPCSSRQSSGCVTRRTQCNPFGWNHTDCHTTNRYSKRIYFRQRNRWLLAALLGIAFWPVPAHASLFKGEALDNVANVMSWVVLVIAPVVGIVVFLLVHILPEKVAEKKHHPQAKAIQCLCLLSLAFGGLLWPLAWLWAYSRPVMYKMAYGTDRVVPDQEAEAHPPPDRDKDEAEELRQLRQRVAELEKRQVGLPRQEGGKA